MLPAIFDFVSKLALKDYLSLTSEAFAATVALTTAVRKVKGYLQGDNTLENNAATIKRHALNHTALREWLKQPKGPRSILMEGAGIAYYGVRGESPALISFDMRKRKDVLNFQKILPHLDDPKKAYAIATGRETPEAVPGDECQDECNEWYHRANRREKGWIRHRDKEKDTAIDESMLSQIDALVKSDESSSGLSEACHIALRHTTAENPDGDIVVMGVTDKFQQAFLNATGTKDPGDFRNQGDNELFDKVLAARRSMANVPTPDI